MKHLQCPLLCKCNVVLGSTNTEFLRFCRNMVPIRDRALFIIFAKFCSTHCWIWTAALIIGNHLSMHYGLALITHVIARSTFNPPRALY